MRSRRPQAPCQPRSQPNVRPANPDEAGAIAAVLRESFVEYERLYTREAFEATTPSAEGIRNRWSEGPVWVAEQGGAIVGTVAAVPRVDRLYVRSMAIVPVARGRGLGRLLLQHVERFAAERDMRRLTLSTTPFLSRAIRLYEQLGFEPTDDGPATLFGTPLLTMEKSLSRE